MLAPGGRQGQPRARRFTAALLAAALGSGAGCGLSTGEARRNLAPPPSAGHSLVYAEDLQLVLLVNAGLGSSEGAPPRAARTRIWGFNGAAWSLVDSTGPPVRNLAGVAYDTRRRTLVMHGGTYDIGVSYGETWEWNRASGWKKFAGAGPGVRDHTQMAYDPDRGRAVLFGGSGSAPDSAFSDTWEFDGARWERFDASGPAGRVHHAMHYDPVSKRVVVHGGFAPGSAPLGDTWGWDGMTWAPVAPATVPRTHASMVFHPRLHALLVIGGLKLSNVRTLQRTAEGWAPLPAASNAPEPGARYLPAAACDSRRRVLVLFGGGDPAGTALLADTWEFDGAAWRRVAGRE